MQTKTKSLLYLSIFFSVLFILKYILFKDIYLVLSNEEDKFSFTNFLIFNYLFTSMGYFIKMILIFGLFKLSLYVFDVEEQSSIFNIVILGELIKILLSDGLKILIYYLFKDMTLEMFSNFKSNYNLSEIFNLHLNNNFETLLNSVNTFDIVYLIFIVTLFSANFKLSKMKSFKVVGMPYLLVLIVFGIVRIFITF